LVDSSGGPRLEDYSTRYAELGRPEQFPPDLIGWEYFVRQRWGIGRATTNIPRGFRVGIVT
jgi:hypothetical protein